MSSSEKSIAASRCARRRPDARAALRRARERAVELSPRDARRASVVAPIRSATASACARSILPLRNARCGELPALGALRAPAASTRREERARDDRSAVTRGARARPRPCSSAARASAPRGRDRSCAPSASTKRPRYSRCDSALRGWPRKTRADTARPSPLTRTIASPPTPDHVAIAAIVSRATRGNGAAAVQREKR